ncbi:MAG: hypothetical protein WB799_03945 [Candidatus Sulfotelmatobacter sp.]
MPGAIQSEGGESTARELSARAMQVGLCSSESKRSLRVFLAALFVVALIIGVIIAWNGGDFSVGDDGVSYLDLSDAWRNHDWTTAANGTWSPAYPVFLAGTLGIVHPSVLWEPIVVRGVNLLIYFGAMLSFAFFWRELTRWIDRRSFSLGAEHQLPKREWFFLGFALFVFFAAGFIGIHLVSPDLGLFAAVFLVAAILVRIKDGDLRKSTFAWLGAACALGYLIKTLMFPMTFVFFAAAFLLVRDKQKAIARVALALAVFVLISSPWVLMLSGAKGRLTYGDAGKINYLWFASEGFNDHGYPFPWKPAPGEGSPLHPMRDLLDSPHIFEFKAPFRGSYPLWNDPSYWYEGARVPFHLKQQLRTVVQALEGYIHIIELQNALIVGALFLLIGGKSWKKGVLSSSFYLVFPALTALGLYAISHGLVQNRYTAPFLPLMWAGLFAELYLLHLKENVRVLAPLSLAMAVLLLVPVTVSLSEDILNTARKLHTHTAFDHYDGDVADYLHSIGLHPGDSLGYLEAPEDGTNKYWARLAKMTIVADLSFQDVDAVWKADASTKAEVVEAFRKAGVRAIVAYGVPEADRLMGWQRVGRSPYYVLPCSDLVSAR